MAATASATGTHFVQTRDDADLARVPGIYASAERMSNIWSTCAV